MPYSAEILADSPSLFLKLDDSAAPILDSSGNNHTQTLGGTFTFTQPGPSSEINYSTLFTAGTIAEDFGLATNYTGVTIEFWYKSTSGMGSIFTSRGATGGGFTVFIGATGAGFGATGKISFGYDGAGVYIGTYTSATFHDNLWHHVVARFERASGSVVASDFAIYVDGTKQATTNVTIGTAPTVPVAPTANWTCGQHGWPNGSINNTYIAMMAIYPLALSEIRIAAHRTAALLPPSPARVATVYADALYVGAKNARVATVYTDVLFTNISSARIASMYNDVLIRNPRPMKGWGVKQ